MVDKPGCVKTISAAACAAEVAAVVHVVDLGDRGVPRGFDDDYHVGVGGDDF